MASVTDRLSSLDASLVSLEESRTALHAGSVLIFQQPGSSFDRQRLLTAIRDQLSLLPRYRQHVRRVPGRLANPVWVDDAGFDLDYHVRRVAVPAPGDDAQFAEMVARVMSRPLDRSRPLWEVYYVEGLRDDRFALLTKTHPALVDGAQALDIAQVLFAADATPQSPESVAPRVRSEPSDLELVASALLENLRRPHLLVDTIRHEFDEVKEWGEQALHAVGKLLTTVVRTAARPTGDLPLNVPVGTARRFLMVRTQLGDYRRVRTQLAHGPLVEDVSVNDVVLATLAGALRSWLMARGEPVGRETIIRALVPVSVRGADIGGGVMACFVELPVGEPSPAMRLHQISFAMRKQLEGGRAVDASSMAGLAGFASPTIHTLGARLGLGISRHFFNVIVTNVPGPQIALYAHGAKLLATYPVIPLVPDQALSIGLTSYAGGVYYGLYADRTAMYDLEAFHGYITDALAELAGDSPRSDG